MPKYNYKCPECGGIFEAIHKMGVDLDVCKLCEKQANLKRIPSSVSINTISAGNQKVSAKQNVEEHIEMNREILKKEKERLQNRSWDDDSD